MSLLDYLRPIWDTGEEYNTPEFLGNLAKGVGRTAQGLGSLASHVITNPTQLDDLIAQVPGALSQLPDYYREQYTGDVASKIYEDPSNYLMDAIDVLTAGAAAGRKIAPYASRFAEAASQPLGTGVRRLAFGPEAPNLGVGESLDRAIELARQGKFHNRLSNEGGFARFRFDDAGGSARPKPGRGGAPVDEGPAALSRLAEARQVAGGTDDVLRQLDRGLDDIEGSRALQELEPWNYGGEMPGRHRGAQGRPGSVSHVRPLAEEIPLDEALPNQYGPWRQAQEQAGYVNVDGFHQPNGPRDVALAQAVREEWSAWLRRMAAEGEVPSQEDVSALLMDDDAMWNWYEGQSESVMNAVDARVEEIAGPEIERINALANQNLTKSSLLGDRYGSLSNYVTDAPRPRPQSGFGSLRNERGSIQFHDPGGAGSPGFPGKRGWSGPGSESGKFQHMRPDAALPDAERARVLGIPPRVANDAADVILQDLDAIDDIIDKARLAASQGQVFIDPDDLAELESYRATLEAQLAGEAGRQTSRMSAQGIDYGGEIQVAPDAGRAIAGQNTLFGRDIGHPHPDEADLMVPSQKDPDVLVKEPAQPGAMTPPTSSTVIGPDGKRFKRRPGDVRAREWEEGALLPGLAGDDMAVLEGRLRSKEATGNLIPSRYRRDARAAGTYPGEAESAGTGIISAENDRLKAAEFGPLVVERKKLLDRKNYLEGKVRAFGDPESIPLSEVPQVHRDLSEIGELEGQIADINAELPWKTRNSLERDEMVSHDLLGDTGIDRDLAYTPARDLAMSDEEYMRKYGTLPRKEIAARAGSKEWADMKPYEQDIRQAGNRSRRARALGKDEPKPRRRSRQAPAAAPTGTATDLSEAVAAARATHGTQAVSAKQIAAEMTDPPELAEIRSWMAQQKEAGTYYSTEGTTKTKAKVKEAAPLTGKEKARQDLRDLGWTDDEIDAALGPATSKADTSASTKTTQPTTETGQSAGRRRGGAAPKRPSDAKLTATRKQLRKVNGKNPSSNEIAVKLGIDIETKEGKAVAKQIKAWLKDQPPTVE